RVEAELQAAIADGKEHDVECRAVLPDGSLRWVLLRGRVQVEGGVPARVTGIGMDITERKRAEEIALSSERLAMVGRMTATVAHEINNPLAAAMNILYLLSHSPIQERFQQLAHTGQEELQRVAEITRTTLGFFRESTQATDVELNQILSGVLSLFAGRVRKRNISVQQDFDTAAIVHGYPGELRQVFSNLIANALDAVQDGGRIAIRVRPTLARGRLNVSGYRILVADDGPGISVDARRRLFAPFYTTKGEAGTGVGLWISQQIVHKHGGFIRMRSRATPPATGTCFAVVLPGRSPN
ncbi:MAG TPA: HAMP domain-containing sensor histidine kinase, partial [Burkholderiales bacterium]|nr:HAMP domain-containing sensor histidine kinase [Burkholderiales bacterium]